MSGYSVTAATGRVQAGEPDFIFMPRTVRRGKRVCILPHPHTLGLSSPWLDRAGFPNTCDLAAYLASNGIPCISMQGGAQPNGNNYANDEAMSRVTAAISVLQAAVTGCATDKVAFVGPSMGGGTAVRYGILHAASVACIYGIIPMASINDIYTNNRGGLQATIATAWGVTAPAALPSGADLAGNASALAAVPGRLDYGGADATVLPATVTALASAWGAACTATQTDNTLGHGDALLGKTSPQTVFSFLTANGC